RADEAVRRTAGDGGRDAGVHARRHRNDRRRGLRGEPHGSKHRRAASAHDPGAGGRAGELRGAGPVRQARAGGCGVRASAAGRDPEEGGFEQVHFVSVPRERMGGMRGRKLLLLAASGLMVLIPLTIYFPRSWRGRDERGSLREIEEVQRLPNEDNEQAAIRAREIEDLPALENEERPAEVLKQLAGEIVRDEEKKGWPIVEVK